MIQYLSVQLISLSIMPSGSIHVVVNGGFPFVSWLRKKYPLISFSLHPCQHLLSVLFLMTAILRSVRQYFIVILICISLIVILSIFSHTVVYLYVFFGKCLFNSSAYFQINFLHWILWALYVFWILIHYQIYYWQTVSPIPQVPFSFHWQFLLLIRSFLVWCSFTHLF